MAIRKNKARRNGLMNSQKIPEPRPGQLGTGGPLFTKSADLDMTPKQAGDAERKAFFNWLDAQKAKEDAERAEKLAKEEAEKQRKKEEALNALLPLGT